MSAPRQGVDEGSVEVDANLIRKQRAAETDPVALPRGMPELGDDSASGLEDHSIEVPVLDNDRDPDGTLDGDSLQLVSGPQHGRACVVEGMVHFDPDPDYSGPDEVIYQVQDNDGNLATGLVSFEIQAVNDPPEIGRIEDQAIASGELLEGVKVAVADSDHDVDTLRFRFSSSNPFLVPDGAIALRGHGRLRTLHVTPVAGRAGMATITVWVVDGEGATSSVDFVLKVETPDFDGYAEQQERADDKGEASDYGPWLADPLWAPDDWYSTFNGVVTGQNGGGFAAPGGGFGPAGVNFSGQGEDLAFLEAPGPRLSEQLASVTSEEVESDAGAPVEPVPLPTAFWLFAGALGLVSIVARRRS